MAKSIIQLYEDLVNVTIGNNEIGQILSTDAETIRDITKIVQSSGVKEKLNSFLTSIGVPKNHLKTITSILSNGDLAKVVKYIDNRTIKIEDVVGKKINALSINDQLFGISNKGESLSLFSYQWPTSPIMGKGEFWLSMVLNGGSSAGTGDVSVNDQILEVKGIGARLVGQKGYGNAKQMVQAFKSALTDIATEVGLSDYSIIDGNNIDWNLTKKDGRLLQQNLESIATAAGKFNPKQISFISRKFIEAYKTLYVNLNTAQYGRILEGAINSNGSINVDLFNRELLVMSFEYYLSIEHFTYFCIANDKSGSVLIIDPKDFRKYINDGTINYVPPSWGEAAGVQGGYYAISIK